MSQSSSCYPCKYPAKYDIASVRWLKSERKLCEEHEKKADVLLAAAPKTTEEPVKKLVPKTNTPMRRLLNEPIKNPRHFSEQADR